MSNRPAEWLWPPESKALCAQVKALTNKLRQVSASYDAARTSPDLQNYWANADAFDADSSHSKGVRHTLIRRSRYEVSNNGYADGIAQTYATDLVGVGPQLRMLTGSPNFNQMVEREWFLWTKATHFRRKLHCMAHAKHVDGEAIAVIRRNPGVNHTVKLDLVLYEAEQCQSPFPELLDRGRIDGIRFDEFGNPTFYEILRDHPGASNRFGLTFDPELVPAEFVLHWFKMRRPGQHRGVPECASTLNLGAAFRRLREANLLTAEKVAAWTLMLKTILQGEDADAPAPDDMATLDIIHGMMTALPLNTEPVQLKAEHPGPTYNDFHATLLSEQARPKSMPRNKAGCDSSNYNYASGRLDHQTYYSELDVDREDGNDLALDPLFKQWFDSAIRRFGWLGGDAEQVGPAARLHQWDWPKHRVADVEAEANANATKLNSGQISLPTLYTDNGLDLEDEIPKMAEAFGVTPEEVRQRLFDVILPPPKQLASASSAGDAAGGAVTAVLNRLNGSAAKLLANGGVHAN